MELRRPAVAGTWYPADAARLSAEVERYVEAVSDADTCDVPGDADVIALVAPHAGLVYSGPVAAHAYRFLKFREYESIVLVGPSHYVGFAGASVWSRGAFDTPLGPLRIDEPAAKRLAAACPVLSDIPEAHEREHSLELQLPFLAALAPSTPIVPIVMGFQTRETAEGLADGLVEALRGRRVLLIASSDLSHFYDADQASALDREVIDRVDALDDDGLMGLLEARADHACGGGPMVSVLRAARALGATRSRVVRYANSGDVSGDMTSVVGYMAAAVWR